jgi:hypothetical protein
MNFMPLEILQCGHVFARLIGICFWELIFVVIFFIGLNWEGILLVGWTEFYRLMDIFCIFYLTLYYMYLSHHLCWQYFTYLREIA